MKELKKAVNKSSSPGFKFVGYLKQQEIYNVSFEMTYEKIDGPSRTDSFNDDQNISLSVCDVTKVTNAEQLFTDSITNFSDAFDNYTLYLSQSGSSYAFAQLNSAINSASDLRKFAAKDVVNNIDTLLSLI